MTDDLTHADLADFYSAFGDLQRAAYYSARAAGASREEAARKASPLFHDKRYEPPSYFEDVDAGEP